MDGGSLGVQDDPMGRSRERLRKGGRIRCLLAYWYAEVEFVQLAQSLIGSCYPCTIRTISRMRWYVTTLFWPPTEAGHLAQSAAVVKGENSSLPPGPGRVQSWALNQSHHLALRHLGRPSRVGPCHSSDVASPSGKAPCVYSGVTRVRPSREEGRHSAIGLGIGGVM